MKKNLPLFTTKLSEIYFQSPGKMIQPFNIPFMETKNSQRSGWLSKQSTRFEEGRFALMTILLTLQSCIGAAAAMLAMQNHNDVLLGICAAVTMASNSFFIAQAPAKQCLIMFYVSVLANLSVLLYCAL